MRWTVAFYEGTPPLVWRDSDHFAWDDLPVGDGLTTGVAIVEVRHPSGRFKHRLSGRDYYWVDPLTMSFGMFNDPSNWDWYGGTAQDQFIAWRWVRDGSERVIPAVVPGYAHVLLGVMLPNEVAWEHGLLPRGETLPARVG